MIVIKIIKINETDAKPERLLTLQEKDTILKDKNGFLLQWGNSERHIYWQAGDENSKEWRQWQNIINSDSVFIRARIEKKNDIDVHTQKIISRGFVFEGHTFSLSPNAQINWMGLKFIEQKNFPLPVLTQEGIVYMIALSKRDDFILASINTKNDALQSGIALKLKVDELTSVQEVNDFIDPRQ